MMKLLEDLFKSSTSEFCAEDDGMLDFRWLY